MLFKKYEDRLKKLEGELFKEDSLLFGVYTLTQLYGERFTKNKKSRVDRIESDICDLRSEMRQLLDYLKVEHFKITEENGSTHVKEGFRKKKMKRGSTT